MLLCHNAGRERKDIVELQLAAATSRRKVKAGEEDAAAVDHCRCLLAGNREGGDTYCCRRLPTPLTFFVAPAQRRSPPAAAVPDQPLHRHLEYVESGGRSCPSSSHVAGKIGKGEWKLCSVAAVMHRPNTARVSFRRRWRFMLAGDVPVAVASSAGESRDFGPRNVHLDGEVNGERPEGNGSQEAKDGIEERENHGHNSSKHHKSCPPYQPEQSNAKFSQEWEPDGVFTCDELSPTPSGSAPGLHKGENGLCDNLRFPGAAFPNARYPRIPHSRIRLNPKANAMFPNAEKQEPAVQAVQLCWHPVIETCRESNPNGRISKRHDCSNNGEERKAVKIRYLAKQNLHCSKASKHE
nr:Os07g0134101 [Ipomoea batatas]